MRATRPLSSDGLPRLRATKRATEVIADPLQHAATLLALAGPIWVMCSERRDPSGSTPSEVDPNVSSPRVTLAPTLVRRVRCRGPLKPWHTPGDRWGPARTRYRCARGSPCLEASLSRSQWQVGAGSGSVDGTFSRSPKSQATGPSEGPEPVTAVSVRLPHSLAGVAGRSAMLANARVGCQTRPDAHRKGVLQPQVTAYNIQRRDGNQAAYGLRHRSTRSALQARRPGRPRTTAAPPG